MCDARVKCIRFVEQQTKTEKILHRGVHDLMLHGTKGDTEMHKHVGATGKRCLPPFMKNNNATNTAYIQLQPDTHTYTQEPWAFTLAWKSECKILQFHWTCKCERAKSSRCSLHLNTVRWHSGHPYTLVVLYTCYNVTYMHEIYLIFSLYIFTQLCCVVPTHQCTLGESEKNSTQIDVAM